MAEGGTNAPPPPKETLTCIFSWNRGPACFSFRRLFSKPLNGQAFIYYVGLQIDLS